MFHLLPGRCAQRGRTRCAVARLVWLALIAVLTALSAPLHAGPTQQDESQTMTDSAPPNSIDAARDEPVEFVIGVVQPCRTASLAPIRQGRIASLEAPEGSRVTAGDSIFRLVDDAQRVRVRTAKAKAETTLTVELAKALWEQARLERDRLASLHGEANATSKEYSDAVSAEEITHLEFEQAGFKHAQDILAYEFEQATLDEFHIRAPFDGYVSRQVKDVGETVYQQEFVVTLVQLNPLLVALDCPLALAPLIRPDDRLTVRPMDDYWSPREGRVVLINAVADGASQTFKVKLAVANDDGHWMSGMKVRVEFASRGSDFRPMTNASKTGAAGVAGRVDLADADGAESSDRAPRPRRDEGHAG